MSRSFSEMATKAVERTIRMQKARSKIRQKLNIAPDLLAITEVTMQYIKDCKFTNAEIDAHCVPILGSKFLELDKEEMVLLIMEYEMTKELPSLGLVSDDSVYDRVIWSAKHLIHVPKPKKQNSM